MFGRGKFQNGIIIEPKEPFNPLDSGKLSQFRNAIWSVNYIPPRLSALHVLSFTVRPSVEEANAFAPTHSRIFKEVCTLRRFDFPIRKLTFSCKMIIVCKPDKPFEYTAKGNARRHPSISMYNEEIEAVYKAVEESSLVDISLPASWEPEEAISFIRSIVARVMKTALPDDVDFFEFGCDRLVFFSPSPVLREKIVSY